MAGIIITDIAYDPGYGAPKQPTSNNTYAGFTELKKAAENGDVNAQYEIGTMYYKGEGVAKNLAEATKWFRKAAEQGFALAQGAVGALHIKNKEYVEAIKWFRKAAENGDIVAQRTIGVTYLDGAAGIPKDTGDALKWLSKAAEQNDAPAQLILGMMYGTGDGVPKDFIEAYKWLNIAAAKNADAKKQLDGLEGFITREQIAEGQRLSREWMEKHSAK